MPDNSFGGGSFTIGDGLPTTPTDTTAAGADTTLVEAALQQALGVDTMEELAAELEGGGSTQIQSAIPEQYSFGDYFVYANKKPLPSDINDIVGFSRNALITERDNTAVVSETTLVAPSNNVRDPIRKVTRNIWTSTSDFKGVQLFESDVAPYDTELTFAENVQNIDFNTEKAQFLKVLYPEDDPEQEQLYLISADEEGRPVRRCKFILRFPPMTEGTSEFQEGQIQAFFDTMFFPSRADTAWGKFTYKYPSQMQIFDWTPEEMTAAEDLFSEKGYSMEGWACSASGPIGNGLSAPPPPHDVEVAFQTLMTPVYKETWVAIPGASKTMEGTVLDTGATAVKTTPCTDGDVAAQHPECAEKVITWEPISEQAANATLKNAFPGWVCHINPIDGKAYCQPIAEVLGSVTCEKVGETQDTFLTYTYDLPKIGLFDVQDVHQGIFSTLLDYQFADHTFEMGLPFPILNSNLSNLSAHTLLGDYDIIFNATDRDLRYENFVSTHYLYEGVCPYTIISSEMNETKGVKNSIYQDLMKDSAGFPASSILKNQKTYKKYLDKYTDNFQRRHTLHKNKNILIRDKEISQEMRKVTSFLPAAISVKFANRHKPDFATLLSSTGLDVVLMSKIAENFTIKEATSETAFDNDPSSLFLTAMIMDVVLSNEPVVSETSEIGGVEVSSEMPEPVAQSFLDVSSANVSSYDLLGFFEDMRQDTRDDFVNLLNPSVDTQVLVENEEKDFVTGHQFCFKNGSATLCKDELLKKAAANTRSVLEIYEGKKCAHEVLFFRIEKKKLNSPSPEPLQNFYIFNDGQDIIEYVDAQVEYGVKYTYRIFAYVLVFGTQYQPFIDDPLYNIKNTKFTINALPLSMLYKPSIRLLEVPYHEYKELSVLSKPPLAPQMSFFPFKYENDKVFMSFVNTNGFIRETPIPVRPSETSKIRDHLRAQKSRVELIFESDDEPASYEVYRTDVKPSSFADIPFHTTINIKAHGKNLIDNIKANKDYWYFFRAIDDHGEFSNPSVIYKLRLIGDHISYLKVEQAVGDYAPKADNKTFGKFIHIAHDGETGAHDEPTVFGKTLKVRIKSLETNEKVDLNIDFSKTHLTIPGTETN
jgi:hypothetical protein